MKPVQKKRRRSASPTSRKKQDTGQDKTTPTAPDVDAGYAEFAELMRGIGVTLDTPATTAPATTPPVPVPAARAKPTNPFTNRVKRIPKVWGSSVHEQMHFKPTTAKPYHGVWRTRDLDQVREWVSLARDSVNADDGFVIASKPGEKGGYNFLVDMDGQTVGYISGSAVPPGTKPPAKHLAVYVNKGGFVATAFPCTPEIF